MIEAVAQGAVHVAKEVPTRLRTRSRQQTARKRAQVHPRFVPWAWGINGLTSVAASILVILLAMRLGFNAVVLMGAGVYLTGALAVALHARRHALPMHAAELRPAE